MEHELALRRGPKRVLNEVYCAGPHERQRHNRQAHDENLPVDGGVHVPEHALYTQHTNDSQQAEYLHALTAAWVSIHDVSRAASGAALSLT